VTCFAAQPATRLATLGTGDGLDGAVPPFPVTSYPAGLSNAMTEGVNFGRMALANPIAAPVDALLERLNAPGAVAHQVTITIPAGVPTTANSPHK
jgi:hypothetical protein